MNPISKWLNNNEAIPFNKKYRNSTEGRQLGTPSKLIATITTMRMMTATITTMMMIITTITTLIEFEPITT